MLIALVAGLLSLAGLFAAVVVGVGAIGDGELEPTTDFARASSVVVGHLGDGWDVLDEWAGNHRVVATMTDIRWTLEPECLSEDLVGSTLELVVLTQELPADRPLAFFLSDICLWTEDAGYQLEPRALTHQVIDMKTELPASGAYARLPSGAQLDRATLDCLAEATESVGSGVLLSLIHI